MFIKILFHNARYAHHIPLSAKSNIGSKYGQPTGRLSGKNQRSLASHLVKPSSQLQLSGAGSSAQLYGQNQSAIPVPCTPADALLALHTQGVVNANTKAIQESGSSMDLPDRETIRKRMESVAIDVGLSSDINSDCVSMLTQATHIYLKNIIAKCIQLKNNKVPKEILDMRTKQEFIPKKGSYTVKKSPFSFKIGSATHSYTHYTEEIPYMNENMITKKRKRSEFEDAGEEEDNSDNEYKVDKEQMMQIAQQDSFVITPRDLLTTVQCCPFLLGDCEKMREKITVANWDLF